MSIMTTSDATRWCRRDGWTLPRTRESQLDNGMRVLAYDCPGQYVIAASLLFDVPLDRGAARHRGRRRACRALPHAGRGGPQCRGVRRRAGPVRRRPGRARHSPDGFAVRLSCPTTHLAPALALMADAVTRRTSPTTSSSTSSSLRLRGDRAGPRLPAARGRRAAQRGALRRLHRAGRPTGGDADTVAGRQPGTTSRRLPRATCGRTRATLRRSPATSHDLRSGCARGRRGASAAGPATMRRRPSSRLHPRRRPAAQLVLVDWPDAPQATLRMAAPGITRADDALAGACSSPTSRSGGTFSSRINTRAAGAEGRHVRRQLQRSTPARSTGSGRPCRPRCAATRRPRRLPTSSTILRRRCRRHHRRRGGTGVARRHRVRGAGFRARRQPWSGGSSCCWRRACRSITSTPTWNGSAAVTTDDGNAAHDRGPAAGRLTIVVVGDAATLREPLRAWGYADSRVAPDPSVTERVSATGEGGVDDVLGLGLHLARVLGAAERLGIDLVDVLGARGPRGEPRRLACSP